MNIEIVNPVEYPNWNQHVAEFEGATIFHTSNWARVLIESYGYKPKYFTAFNQRQAIGCIPFMGVESLLTGHRGVSLPFSDACSPLGNNESVQTLWNVVLDHVARSRWKYVEIRGSNSIFESEPSNSAFKVHEIELNIPESELLKKFRNSTRRNISVAKKNKVVIKFSMSMKAMKAFYTLHCITRRRHGLPPQPFAFFENILKFIIARNKGFILTATHGGSIIAAAIIFVFNDAAFYKYGASNMAYQSLRANNLIMWSGLQRCINFGLKRFNFGRTDPSNTGLMQFKRGWNADEKNLLYYKYLIRQRCFVRNVKNLKSLHPIFKRMPLPLLKLAGRVLYRHAG